MGGAKTTAGDANPEAFFYTEPDWKIGAKTKALWKRGQAYGATGTGRIDATCLKKGPVSQ